MLVAIDGPAGAGKSTVARALARALGFTYLDSGAMYRCVALAALEQGGGALPERPGALDALARAATIELGDAPAGASPGAPGAVLLDGRDIGTVVAPDAAVKVFLTADPRERARRRAAELGADVETVLAEQAMRDERDSSREHSPLQAAPDAVALDTSGLSVDEVVQRIAELVAGR